MTLREYIYQIKDTANSGQENRANELGDRLVESWITRYRNMLVAQDIKRNGSVDSNLIQDLGCLTLQKADVSMCHQYCFGESTYYVCLPSFLELPNSMGMEFFGLVDKQTKIPISEYTYGNYSNYNRFAPKRIYGEMIGRKVFLHNVDPIFPIEGINVRGVFSDPANLQTDCGDLKCFDWDKDNYPMLTKLNGALFDMIYQKELNIVFKSISDKTADDVTAEKI